MADMDSMVIRDRPGEYIVATLGPDADKCSKIDIYRMIVAAIHDVRDGNGQDIDLNY